MAPLLPTFFSKIVYSIDQESVSPYLSLELSKRLDAYRAKKASSGLLATHIFANTTDIDRKKLHWSPQATVTSAVWVFASLDAHETLPTRGYAPLDASMKEEISQNPESRLLIDDQRLLNTERSHCLTIAEALGFSLRLVGSIEENETENFSSIVGPRTLPPCTPVEPIYRRLGGVHSRWLIDCYSQKRIIEKAGYETDIMPQIGEHTLQGARVYLGDFDKEPLDKTQSAEELIRRTGGVVTKTFEEADAILMRYDDGHKGSSSLVNRALAIQKSVVTSYYIEDFTYSGTELTQSSFCLYVPPVRDIRGAQSLNVAVSGFAGLFRIDVQDMIGMLGASLTRNMGRNETGVLVCGEPHTEKHIAAINWGIPVVNHLWLEHSILAGQLLDYGDYRDISVSVRRSDAYGRNLQKKMKGLVGPPAPVNERLKRYAAADFSKWVSRLKKPDRAAPAPRTTVEPAQDRVLAEETPAVHVPANDEVDDDIHAGSKRPRRRIIESESGSDDLFKIPKVSENEKSPKRPSPEVVVIDSKSAGDKGHNAHSPQVLHGIGQESAISGTIGSPVFDEGCDQEPSASIFQFTGNISKPDVAKFTKTIEGLGGSVSNDMDEVTHLILGDIVRSEKFLLACAMGKWILRTSYIHSCEAAETFVDAERHELYGEDTCSSGTVWMGAPRRWREHLMETGERAFEEKIVIMHQPHSLRDKDLLKKCKTYIKYATRVVKAGGGIVTASSECAGKLSEMCYEGRKPFAVVIPKGVVGLGYSDEFVVEALAAGIPIVREDFLFDFLSTEKTPTVGSYSPFEKDSGTPRSGKANAVKRVNS